MKIILIVCAVSAFALAATGTIHAANFEHRFPEEVRGETAPEVFSFVAVSAENATALRYAKDYLTHGKSGWGHPDTERYPWSFIGEDGQMSSGGGADPRLVWSSPFGAPTTVRVKVAVTNSGAGEAIGRLLHGQKVIWETQSLPEDQVRWYHAQIEVQPGEKLSFETRQGNGLVPSSVEAGGLVWNLSVTQVGLRSPGNTTYYVDSVLGNDDNPGTSEQGAWKSLSKVNSTVFAPGDRILLRAGRMWNGQLYPQGSGAAGRPIVIDRYGEGDRPLLNGSGKVESVVYLYDQEYWEIHNLEIVSRNHNGVEAYRNGIGVCGTPQRPLNYFRVKNCYVHHVTGNHQNPHVRFNNQHTFKWHGGIMFRGGTFNDLIVDSCKVVETRLGIVIHNEGKYAEGVVVRNCSVYRSAGDPIVVYRSLNPIIEYSVAGDCNHSRFTNFGISGIVCTGMTIQFCEAYLTRNARGDVAGVWIAAGQGFGSDHDSVNQTVQYCYSHDNENGFYAAASRLYSPQEIFPRRETPRHNRGSIVRYCISQNDLTNREGGVLKVGGNGHGALADGRTEDAVFYNNTIYIAPGLNSRMIWMPGTNTNTRFFNNIFVNHGSDGSYDFDRSTGTVFENNLFFGNRHHTEPADPKKVTADPRLAAPGTGWIGRDSVAGYKLTAGSPAIDAGRVVPNDGGQDYFGNKLADGKPDIGAHEFSPSGK
jgi:hypothetical protein